MPEMTPAVEKRHVKAAEYGALKGFFTPKQVAKLVGISYRQIQYWDKTNFISPSYHRRGKYRLYTFGDLILLRVAKALRDNGFSIQQLRKTIINLRELLPQTTHPFSELTLLIEGERILVFSGEVLMNSVSAQSCIRFDVRTLREEISAHFPPKQIAPATEKAEVIAVG